MLDVHGEEMNIENALSNSFRLAHGMNERMIFLNCLFHSSWDNNWPIKTETFLPRLSSLECFLFIQMIVSQLFEDNDCRILCTAFLI